MSEIIPHANTRRLITFDVSGALYESSFDVWKQSSILRLIIEQNTAAGSLWPLKTCYLDEDPKDFYYLWSMLRHRSENTKPYKQIPTKCLYLFKKYKVRIAPHHIKYKLGIDIPSKKSSIEFAMTGINWIYSLKNHQFQLNGIYFIVKQYFCYQYGPRGVGVIDSNHIMIETYKDDTFYEWTVSMDTAWTINHWGTLLELQEILKKKTPPIICSN